MTVKPRAGFSSSSKDDKFVDMNVTKETVSSSIQVLVRQIEINPTNSVIKRETVQFSTTGKNTYLKIKEKENEC